MKQKQTVEFLLSRVDISGAGFQKILLKSRNLITVDLIWPRSAIARKTASREAVFAKSKADFSAEEWTKRILFREDVEGHAGVAVSVSESLNTENIEKFLRLTAKLAFKTGSDVVQKFTVWISDVASAPIDALSSMVGTYPGPKQIAQGVSDIVSLPGAGEETELQVPLVSVRRISGRVTKNLCGSATLLLRALS